MVDAPKPELQELALQKMTAVLGAERARALLVRTLEHLGLVRIDTAQELMTFSEALTNHGGFVATVGAMLGVAAVLRGATPTGTA